MHTEQPTREQTVNRGQIDAVLLEDLREKLADYAHFAWSGWMKYLFSKSTQLDSGDVVIPAALVERWTRQLNTSYKALPPEEQQTDLEEADRMLAILKQFNQTLLAQYSQAVDLAQKSEEPSAADDQPLPVTHQLRQWLNSNFLTVK